MTSTTFTSADGLTLHGDLAGPDGAPVGAVAVCHPHPQFGGSMDTWMPPVLQQALADAGWLALRFDFRGVGRSEGSFGGGAGEQEDLRGAVAFLRERAPGPVLVGGWSFGAMVALAVAAADPGLAGWFGVSVPWLHDPAHGLPHVDTATAGGFGRPALVVQGTHDEICPPDCVRPLADALGARLEVLEGDHFLVGHGQRLHELVAGLAGVVADRATRHS